MSETSFGWILVISGITFLLLGYRINDYSHLVQDKYIMFFRKPIILIIDTNENRIMYSTFILQIIGYFILASGVIYELLECSNLTYLLGGKLLDDLKIIFVMGTVFVVAIMVVIMLTYEYKARK